MNHPRKSSSYKSLPTVEVSALSCKAKIDELLHLYRVNGFFVVSNLLPKPAICEIEAKFSHAWSNGPAIEVPSIHQGKHRTNLALDLAQPSADAANHIIEVTTNFLVVALGKTVSIEELALLISFPGAAEQPFHPDALSNQDSAQMLSVFVPLHDVSLAMGPLEIIPTNDHDGRLQDNESSLVFDCPAGTGIIMNSSTWHRGRDNVSCQPRPVFYLSLMGKGKSPDGPTWTMGQGQGTQIYLEDEATK